MSRVLVTGSAGRLGRSVVSTLAAAGHEVIGVDHAAGTPDEAAATLPADLTDTGEAFETIARFRPDTVIHLAAIATPFSRPESVIFKVNTQLAFNVCEASVALGVAGVVLASSPTVLGYGAPGGWAPAYLPIDEEHPVRPWNAYNLSKVAAEQTMKAFAVAGTTKLAAVRPCFVIPPEEWAGAPTQSGHTVKERLDRPGLAGVSLFNYIDSRDAADMIAVLAQALPELPNGEVFFAGAADALARKPLAELLPQAVPGTEQLAAGLTGTAPAFSTTKAERLLGWQPKRSWRTELKDV
ncbi:NAD(P)-dependent oxidoreductase [Nonomuraea sp. KC401]|uniref:NAD-dependent epimerase/dehydratase family protein n=1 Tax=unclassified Nonomuraea TaxID=2593643 RepID=UPI0010FE37B9|nr:NAD(P)-dependent oxidoreductase [Nonomuraea sp. KC401]NBE93346.1 NAD-dependent epimerase/dehydratase family protein [Nonomuraea sp. K271]TLF73467.1 NAD(P)-dependent oxidoreductase [Nonomuraea sp. KC401]